ncbi:succinate dehydrogenase, iron-sulfur protein [Myxococcus xanthus DK 1622]|uniref:succinate dehydrogenase n=1 Tax=Myxococcus xanthus (strain DK1622) TaxID=246197 RepID=Q1D6J0_MYXXD|nr:MULTISPECIES: succinate dehydrogenase iron-sulfur subunit [Myxococcus]ABF86260.1 succinate dehydrogenase, iron-sulfur protein [Myxococcus xanthus DK 1622]NOJ51943.1 succinate dehydrogenase iron-sulfur subunit [Myxococcus xanthus]QPM82954.1 succinate dehydrogenase iron-sulfur subunit [Myxococcus xanthus]QVW65260.1 succinate dehydrogenase iron-sulfur subunit [Myxococcus xanthus DZ2]QZZ51236.1 Fumarate reductase iron-sulfur subunit [Myxococcus xanthus]
MDTAQASAVTTKTITFRIWRQDDPAKPGHFDEFKVPYAKGANVISCLMEIQRNPVTVEGKRVAPVIWDAACLEEVCGSCAMNINGRVRMACSALIDKLEQPITLEPMSKFPVVRDLTVNRDRMFDALKRIKGWVPIDGTHNLGPGPRQAPVDQSVMYVLSTCITCGSCLEACPQVTQENDFVGAAAISQARLFNMNPTGKMNSEERVRSLMGPGGIQDCGKAQNCVKVCPKEIPLVTSIAVMNREVTKLTIKDIFFQDEAPKGHGSGPG